MRKGKKWEGRGRLTMRSARSIHSNSEYHRCPWNQMEHSFPWLIILEDARMPSLTECLGMIHQGAPILPVRKWSCWEAKWLCRMMKCLLNDLYMEKREEGKSVPTLSSQPVVHGQLWIHSRGERRVMLHLHPVHRLGPAPWDKPFAYSMEHPG